MTYSQKICNRHTHFHKLNISNISSIYHISQASSAWRSFHRKIFVLKFKKTFKILKYLRRREFTWMKTFNLTKRTAASFKYPLANWHGLAIKSPFKYLECVPNKIVLTNHKTSMELSINRVSAQYLNTRQKAKNKIAIYIIYLQINKIL